MAIMPSVIPMLNAAIIGTAYSQPGTKAKKNTGAVPILLISWVLNGSFD